MKYNNVHVMVYKEWTCNVHVDAKIKYEQYV